MLAAVALAFRGCGRDEPPPPTSAPVDAEAVKARLVGDWVRQWDFAPVISQLILRADGSATMRQYRAPAEGTGSTTAPSMHHRHYDQDLPLARETTGSWSLAAGRLTLRMTLSNGDPLVLHHEVSRAGDAELVLKAAGGRGQELRYVRRVEEASPARP